MRHITSIQSGQRYRIYYKNRLNLNKRKHFNEIKEKYKKKIPDFFFEWRTMSTGLS